MCQMSEQINELAGALAKAQGELKPAAMNATNPFLKNRYADLGAVIEAAKVVLPKYGLSVSQLVSSDADKIAVTTILMHQSGQWLKDTASLVMGEERGKSAAQVAGSIITYMRRYAYASIVGIYADEDTDGETKAQPTPDKTAPQPAATPETPRAATPKDNGWIQNDKARGAFWAWCTEQGLSHAEVHEALGVTSLKEYTGDRNDAREAVNGYIASKAGNTQEAAK